jgi:hypothetical protein
MAVQGGQDHQCDRVPGEVFGVVVAFGRPAGEDDVRNEGRTQPVNGPG